jgi:hypothetical protein
MKDKKLPLFVILGIIFWFSGAMTVRAAGNLVFSENNPMMIAAFILAVPITLILLYITKLVAKIQYAEMYRAIVIMTYTATFLDGIALTWFGGLYGNTFEVRLYGAAWILWGAGLGLLLGHLLENQDKKASN